MSGRNQILALVLGAVVIIAAIAGVVMYLRGGGETGPPGPLATPGRWPASERTAFIDACVKSCRAAPGVTPAQHPVCDQACTCGADEGEKIVSGEELVGIYKAMQSGKASDDQRDKLEKMKAAGIACAQRPAK